MIEPSPWPTYNKAHEDGQPFVRLSSAIEKVTDREAALDLGAGPLKETKVLLNAGFRRVVVVDNEVDVVRRVRDLHDARVDMHRSAFQEYDFPHEVFSLVSAVKSLPFIPPNEFDSVFEKVKASLKPGGILVGNLFGMRHAFSHNPNMTFFENKLQVEALFEGMEILFLEETDADKVTNDGPMHWHTFDFIVRKV